MDEDAAGGLEVGADVRRVVPVGVRREADLIIERKGANCVMCQLPIATVETGALIALSSSQGVDLAFAHRDCHRSKLIQVDGRLPQAPARPDTFEYRWYLLERNEAPGAVLVWELLTIFRGEDSDNLMAESLTKGGFEPTASSLKDAAPPKSPLFILRQSGGLTLGFAKTGGVGTKFGDESPPPIWTRLAERDQEVLILEGTNLGLNAFDLDHLEARMATGDVIGAVVAFENASSN